MMEPPEPLETLRQVNEILRSTLVRFRPERQHCSNIRPQDFSGLLGELLRAAECLRRASSSESSAALDKESLEYRTNLERLKHFLPDLHTRLLAEKTRLETARAHLNAAQAWTRARRIY